QTSLASGEVNQELKPRSSRVFQHNRPRADLQPWLEMLWRSPSKLSFAAFASVSDAAMAGWQTKLPFDVYCGLPPSRCSWGWRSWPPTCCG
ncbi:hypothetical protein, partial [Ovoidimarina sediminis]|uniref:hypothetical protein n=1 Tax=Ovoidimarina sediminis TaxID=3079856 RepID=UPI002912606C